MKENTSIIFLPTLCTVTCTLNPFSPNINIYFFLKHFSGPESEILEFDWLLTRVPPVQFFPIQMGFVMVTAQINRAKTIE